MIKKSIKSIIFDMDGTILDSSFAMLQSVNYVRDFISLPAISKDFLEYHINQPDQDLPMLFYGTKEYDPTHKELFKNHYLENANLHVKMYDGVIDTLKELQQRDIELSIATNASDFFAINMLTHQKIEHFFRYIIGSNCVSKPKPNPDMIHHIVQKSNVALEEVLLVGDSIKDELAAQNANIHFLFANWGYGQSDTESLRLDSFEQILEYV